jgi:hypothetical protein
MSVAVRHENHRRGRTAKNVSLGLVGNKDYDHSRALPIDLSLS